MHQESAHHNHGYKQEKHMSESLVVGSSFRTVFSLFFPQSSFLGPHLQSGVFLERGKPQGRTEAILGAKSLFATYPHFDMLGIHLFWPNDFVIQQFSTSETGGSVPWMTLMVNSWGHHPTTVCSHVQTPQVLPTPIPLHPYPTSNTPPQPHPILLHFQPAVVGFASLFSMARPAGPRQRIEPAQVFAVARHHQLYLRQGQLLSLAASMISGRSARARARARARVCVCV